MTRMCFHDVLWADLSSTFYIHDRQKSELYPSKIVSMTTVILSPRAKHGYKAQFHQADFVVGTSQIKFKAMLIRLFYCKTMS